MASCTDLSVVLNNKLDESLLEFIANDCVNGTMIPREILPPNNANYTLINRLFLVRPKRS